MSIRILLSGAKPGSTDTLLNILEEQIPDIGYKEEKSIVIQVQQDEDGSLYISSEDLQNLDRLIIDYGSTRAA